MANLRYSDKHNMVAFLKKPTESVGFTKIVDFLKGTSLRYALTHNPTIYDSLVKQFWQTATVRTLANGIQELVASIDNKEYTITEASIRSQLQLADATGITNLPDAEIYEGLATLGYVSEGKLTFWKKNFTPQWKFIIYNILHCISPKSGGWDQFGSTIATALICLSSNRVYNFSKMIFDGMVHNLERENVPLLPAMLAGAAPDQGTEIPQSQDPTVTPVADEATTTGMGVETEGATTTTTGLDAGLDNGNIHESPLRSHEAPLPKGDTSESADLPIDASSLPNADLPIDPNIADLEDDFNVFPNDGIFSGAYDDEDMGAEADFNNMDNTIDVSPIPTLRVHKDHPKGQILGDPKSAVQTRGKIQKDSSA
ncbi:hypothetical protein Tco_1398811 [Tanacetum coccineum]